MMIDEKDEDPEAVWLALLGPKKFSEFKAIGDCLIMIMGLHAELAEFEVLAREFNESAVRGRGPVGIFDVMVDLKPHIQALNSKLARGALVIRTLLPPAPESVHYEPPCPPTIPSARAQTLTLTQTSSISGSR